MAALRHALWIGGPPGSGKTSIAKRIARRHGLRWYSADAYTWQHRDRALRAGNEAARRWEELKPEALDGAYAGAAGDVLHFERGPMIVDDVRRLPRSPLIVVEGSTVSPAVVDSGAAERSRAVWLQPHPSSSAARATSKPAPQFIEREVREHGAPVLTVDGSRDVEEMAALVEELFADAFAEDPHARTLSERRRLLREANTMVVPAVSRPGASLVGRRSGVVRSGVRLWRVRRPGVHGGRRDPGCSRGRTSSRAWAWLTARHSAG